MIMHQPNESRILYNRNCISVLFYDNISLKMFNMWTQIQEWNQRRSRITKTNRGNNELKQTMHGLTENVVWNRTLQMILNEVEINY